MNNDKKTYPLVSLITVNYNQSKVTAKLLLSLRNATYPNIEIIVVDNASPSDIPEQLKQNFPEIKLIQSTKNLGFAGGNNLGIKESRGEYLMFLNNDTEVPPDFLQPLVEMMENDSAIGMVSPKIKFHWNPELIQYAGYTKMNPYTLRNSSIGFHQKDTEEFNKAEETAAAHGAAMMVPRRVIREVGLMPELYFLYYEEHDWAEMIKGAGHKVFYQPKSYILHKESVSTGKASPLKTYYLTRNRLIFARRNLKGLTKLISIIFQVCISWPKNTVKFLVNAQFVHAKAYFRGIYWNFTHFKIIKENPKLISL